MRLSGIIFLAAALFFTSSLICAGGGDETGNITSDKLARKHDKYADFYERRAAEYERKAAGSVDKESEKYRTLANDCRACAQQKRKIAEAYRTGDAKMRKKAEAEYKRIVAKIDGSPQDWIEIKVPVCIGKGCKTKIIRVLRSRRKDKKNEEIERRSEEDEYKK